MLTKLVCLRSTDKYHAFRRLSMSMYLTLNGVRHNLTLFKHKSICRLDFLLGSIIYFKYILVHISFLYKISNNMFNSLINKGYPFGTINRGSR